MSHLVVKIADPLLMREINKYHVLETIRCFGRISRVEISERTLLSGTTVSAITAALIDEGLIEAIHTGPVPEGQRGRPRVLLDLIPKAAYVVGIRISEALTTTTIANFKGETVASTQLPIRLARQTADVIVDLIEDAVRECIAKSGIDAKALKGIGIGVPGIVDPRSGQSHASSVFGEREMPIAPLLEKRMGMPVKIEKPAHLVALAESWFGYAQRNRSFAVVTVDQTAGLGLWYEDDLLRGASTLGPAFGHIKVGKDERPCECGQKGCLNAYVSAVALREEARSVLAPEFLATAIAGNNFIAALSDAANRGNAAGDGPAGAARRDARHRRVAHHQPVQSGKGDRRHRERRLPRNHRAVAARRGRTQQFQGAFRRDGADLPHARRPALGARRSGADAARHLQGPLEHVQWLRRPLQCSPSASASSAQAISRMPI